ncbi:hypothetical protein B484DRAFT_392840 [Ochromonadaceae sp. CCMP2298]|nr:hypothetical protein B484DRAFT_392840 [Ochromonadaceae sp. CCMP2298]
MLEDVAARMRNKELNTRGYVKRVAPGGQSLVLQTAVDADKAALGASTLVQSLVQTYLASLQDSVEKSEGVDIRGRTLSSLAQSFSCNELNRYVFQGTGTEITRHHFETAKKNSLALGAGRVVPKVKSVRQTLDRDSLADEHHKLTFAVDFVKQCATNLAFGTTRVTQSNGEVLEMPSMELTSSKSDIIRRYREAVVRINAEAVAADPEIQQPPLEELREAHLLLIIETLGSGKENKNLAALDSVYASCCLENFKLLDKLIDIITVGRDADRLHLKKLSSNFEKFLRHEYGGHIFGSSLCPAHCKRTAFGIGYAEETAGGVHGAEESRDSFCDECFQADVLKESVEQAIRTATLKEGEETAELLRIYFNDYIVRDLLIFIGHLQRKFNELTLEQEVFDSLNRETDVVIRIDYKMKLLSILWRESMAQFFGKRGISWLGVAFTRFKTPAEVALDGDRRGYKSEVVTDFMDGLGDDSKEDAWGATRLLAAAVTEYKRKNPSKTRSHVISDGAGCFAGTEFFVFLAYMGMYTGIFVLRHFVTEAGCGKSFLDGHFSYALSYLCHVCADGRGSMDVECAASAVRNLVSGAGVQNSLAVLYTLHGHPTKDDTKSKKNLPGLDLHALREYVYDAAGHPLLSRLTKVPFLEGVGPDVESKVTKQDQASKLALINERRMGREERSRAEGEKKAGRAVAAVEQSRLFKCRVDGCNFVCLSDRRLGEHEALDDPKEHGQLSRKVLHSLHGPLRGGKATDGDLVRDTCHSAASGVKIIASRAAGRRVFKLDHLLSDQQFKAHFGGSLADLQQKEKNAVEREEEQERRARDPFRAAIFTKTKPQLIAKLKMLRNRKYVSTYSR